MDGCSSWMPFLAVSAIGDSAVSSRSGLVVEQKQDLPISSQVEEQLQQFYVLMDMEKNGHQSKPEVVPSSESSKFPFFSESPDETMSLKRQSSNNSNSRHCPAEVSSQQIQLSSVTYGGDCHYGQQGFGNLDTILNLDEFKCQETHNNGHDSGGAFMPYVRHRNPKKKLNKPGSGGQRAIKAAMSAVANIHMVRLAQWRQCYQMEMAAGPPTGRSNCNQQQHVLLERKRREKINDSFKALRTVLPPATKKDKASILITARDYVSTLESRLSELEEENRMLLVELQHRHNNGGGRDDEKIEVDIDINREACTAKGTSQEFFT